MKASAEAGFQDELFTDWFGTGPVPRYRLTRFVFLRALGFIYYVAFVSLTTQLSGLLGERGILPVAPFLERVSEHAGGRGAAFWELPSVFWWNHSDLMLHALGWFGVALSLIVVAGFANALVLGSLWLLYLSFVHVGQIFYGYGWEILLLETGFLAIFLVPLRRGGPAGPEHPSRLVMLLLRWVLFRVMFGAGLIKLRGDSCWTDLTCLIHHYETQPNPHPLSWLWHQAPALVHKGGALFNHFVELVVPWGYFGPRRVRHAAGALTVAFQVALILSGNLSFLNWLTIAVALSCFDDSSWRRMLPRTIVERLDTPGVPERPRRATFAVHVTLSLLIALMSIGPVLNMLSPRQRMNASFDPFHLVNTYGAFGSVGAQRFEVVLEGTSAQNPDDSSQWREYEFICKPGDPSRVPCWVTPFHYRLDWQMWFAALGSYESQPWIVNLVHRLLSGEAAVMGLLETNPFPTSPPRYIRARLYEYRFTSFGQDGWWTRSVNAEYLKPVSLEDPDFLEYLRRFGWLPSTP